MTICAKYTSDYEGEKHFEERSSFSIKGYEYEVRNWGLPEREIPNGKLLCSLYKVEPSMYHPAVMGKMEVYEGGYREWLNPWFDTEHSDKIYNELKDAASKIINNK